MTGIASQWLLLVILAVALTVPCFCGGDHDQAQIQFDTSSSSSSVTVTVTSDDQQRLSKIDPDSGIVINWTALEEIAVNYSHSPPEEWLPPPTANCSCLHMKYRPLYCPWYLKPFRDPFDFVVTETTKWPVSRKLLSCHTNTDDTNNSMLNGPIHTGLPMIAFFGTECCRVFDNATQGYMALSAFDDCWYEKDELQTCFAQGHRVPQHLTNLSPKQYQALLRNATYADRATPHL
ncbi:expressed unknown protein [Seminavis robusta]|uniref:Uncharacterized protein n=1 Tax=Seminavis robusta TaxID=568900 RepID=A0A9N8DTB3_9STRA|nr:expressed unknown protein [Seminavis robusta]|eukprot:Sro235_g094820.1 n/a (234) ;mRNA; r:72493-73194